MIVVRPVRAEKLKVLRFGQLKNANELIVLSDVGFSKFTVVRLVHPEKQLIGIVTTPDPEAFLLKVTLTRFTQSLNCP